MKLSLSVTASVDFRLYVTSYNDRQIYAYDELGNLVETSFPMADPIMGIAFDRFTSNYTVTPTSPSFVFSTVNVMGGSDLYRQYADSIIYTPQLLFSGSSFWLLNVW